MRRTRRSRSAAAAGSLVRTVHLRVSEDADTHYDWELEAIADEFGNIVNRDFYPRQDEVYRAYRHAVLPVGGWHRLTGTINIHGCQQDEHISDLLPEPIGNR